MTYSSPIQFFSPIHLQLDWGCWFWSSGKLVNFDKQRAVCRANGCLEDRPSLCRYSLGEISPWCVRGEQECVLPVCAKVLGLKHICPTPQWVKDKEANKDPFKL